MISNILGKYLSDLNRDFIKDSESKLCEYGLTLNMWRCMMVIESNENCSLKDIAKALNVDNAIITRNIKKLEELHYIIKLKKANDNRFFDLCLTEKGKDILDLINNYQLKWYDKIMKDFTNEERDNLINLLEKLCKNIK